MKRTKKFLVGLLATLSVLSGALSLAACGGSESSSNKGEATEIEKVYAQYVIYAHAEGQTPLSYEEWLATIKGEKGDKGDTGAAGADGVGIKNAYINEDGELIVELTVGEPKNLGKIVGEDGAQGEKGEKGDTGAQGEKGEKGDTGAQGEKGDTGAQGEKGDAGAQGVGIEKVEFDENGDLLITFTDGTKQMVEMPEREEHAHTFGEWENFTTDETSCEDRLLFRTCTDCKTIEWKQGAYTDHDFTTVTTEPTCQAGGYDTKTCEICGKVETVNPTPIADHAWATEYSFDNSYHWIDCNTCDEFKDKQEHSIETSGECSICKMWVRSTEGVIYEVLSDNTAQVVAYEGTATRVRIADTYQGAPVIKIGKEAFKNSVITNVVIPESVTSIGSRAFSDCDSLTSVTIPNSVTSMDGGVFSGCGNLTSVTLSDYIDSISPQAFNGCIGLTSINIPDSVTYIGEQAFCSCYTLTSISIPNGVTSIGNGAFSNCHRVTGVTIPDSVTSIGDRAFNECNSLTSVMIPDSVISIGMFVFSWSKSLESITVAENNVNYKSIDGNLYSKDGTKLIQYAIGKKNSSFVIPKGVTSINNQAFSECYSLVSVTISDGVISIGKEAFYECDNLDSIVIPDSVTFIGDAAFNECSSLTSVYISSIESWCSISFGDFTSNPLIEASNLYLKNELVIELKIPDGVTSIGEYAFQGSNSLSVTIPNSVTSIGDSAFRNCSGLTSITIGNGVTSIGKGAFSGCAKLVEVVNKSTHITIEKGSTDNGYVGYHALAVYNSGDTFVSKISNDNGYIVYSDEKEKILIGYKGTETNLTLPSYITKIYQYAFYYFYGLTNVTIGDSVTSIGNSAFSGCSGLTSIEIPDGVTSIGSCAFQYCDGLTSITIGGNVTFIGDRTFYNCSGLTSITFNGKVEEWNAIEKGSSWKYNVHVTKVVCSDGNASL